MKLLKILLCGLLMTLPVLAEESDDRQTATSLRYVSHELDTRQNKLTTGQDKALTYTNSAGNVEQRTVKENLNGGTTDTSLPMVNAVNAGLNTKQDDISAIDDHTAVTYTGQTGTIGAKGIYQDSGTYAEQSDNLIDAKTFNAALKNGLDNEFVCADRPDARDPNTNLCWLWEIHNTYNAAAQPYISATGTVVQNGTPTPTNPIYPTFYQQGNMVLRQSGNVADTYDATTRKITRRVGVKVFDGTEDWTLYGTGRFAYKLLGSIKQDNQPASYCSHYKGVTHNNVPAGNNRCSVFNGSITTTSGTLGVNSQDFPTVDMFKEFLIAQYVAGTPVTVWYPLAEPVEEDWSATTYNENVYIPQNQ